MKFIKRLLSHLENIDASLHTLSGQVPKLEWLERYIDDKKTRLTGGDGLCIMSADGNYTIGVDPMHFDCFTGKMIDIKAKNAVKVLVVRDSGSTDARYTLEPPKTFGSKGWMWMGKTLVVSAALASEMFVSESD